MNERWLSDLAEHLPVHAEVVADLGRAVEASDQWRSLLVGCSLGSGRGDEFSDIDAGICYAEPLSDEELERSGLELIAEAGDVLDVLVPRFEGWQDNSRRFAVEYDSGVQLDLAVFPAPWRRSRPGEVPIVDKDGDLAHLLAPPVDLVDVRLRKVGLLTHISSNCSISAAVAGRVRASATSSESLGSEWSPLYPSMQR